MFNYQVIDSKGKQLICFWAESDDKAYEKAKSDGWPKTAMLVRTIAPNLE